LTSVTMNANISFVKDTFGGCDYLTTLVIGGSVETIGDEAFDGCRKLTSVTFGASVKTIGLDVFSRTNVTGLHLPDGVQTVRRLIVSSVTQADVDAANCVDKNDAPALKAAYKQLGQC